MTLARAGLVANPTCSGTPAARKLDPALGQVQLPVDQGVAGAAGVHQVDGDPGVLDSPGGAGVLALHANGRVPFLRSPVSSTTRTASGSLRCSTA